LLQCKCVEPFKQTQILNSNLIRQPISNNPITIGIYHGTPSTLITHIKKLQEIGNQTKEDSKYDNVPIQYLNPQNIKNP